MALNMSKNKISVDFVDFIAKIKRFVYEPNVHVQIYFERRNASTFLEAVS